MKNKLLKKYNEASDKDKVTILMIAMHYMQGYNGRPITFCILLATNDHFEMGYEYNTMLGEL